MSDYGKIDILWLDGGWVSKESNQDIRMDEIAAKARKLQPGLLVVDRAVEGPNQNYLTPENTVPKEMLSYPWESCIIMGGGWSYEFNAKYKSGRELIHLLVDIVAKGGNLLLNIAPSPQGTWDAEAYQRLADIGNWMMVNQEAIYGTRKIAPFNNGPVYYTRKKDGSALYIIYCLKEGEKLPAEIMAAGLETVQKPNVDILGYKGKVSYVKTEKGILLKVPKAMQKESDLPYALVFRVR